MEIDKPSWVKKFNISVRLGLIIVCFSVIHIFCLRINGTYKSNVKLYFIIAIAEQNNEEKKMVTDFARNDYQKVSIGRPIFYIIYNNYWADL